MFVIEKYVQKNSHMIPLNCNEKDGTYDYK